MAPCPMSTVTMNRRHHKTMSVPSPGLLRGPPPLAGRAASEASRTRGGDTQTDGGIQEMKRYKLVPIGAALLLLAGVCTGCNKLKARNELNEGVMAFKNSQFAEAVDHFQRAVSYDPTMVNARMFLATALAQQYVPSGNTPDNIAMGNRAIQAYQKVLQVDPKNTNAMGSIATIYYGMHNYAQAKVYEGKVMQIEPNSPDPHYWFGVLDWYMTYPRDMQLRVKLNLSRPKNPAKSQELPPLPPKDRDELVQQNGSLVQEGIENLNKAIHLRPNNAAEYTYLDLLYIQKADLEGSNDEREADLQKSSQLADRALALMKAASTTKVAASPNAS
jgi:tetratricopeptide (TPR) repeat protein